MKKNKKILIFTDHTTHIETDSFYKICNEIIKSDYFIEVSIVSKEFNKNFFEKKGNYDKLIGHNIDSVININFNWDKDIKYINIKDYDVVLLRVDQPLHNNFLINVDSNFYNSTIINDPHGMIETNSKEFLINFKEFIPGFGIIDNYKDIIEISQKKEIVLKPIKSYGGIGISKVYKDTYYIQDKKVDELEFREHIINILNRDKKIVIMDYLKNISKGDKRILIVNGRILSPLLRIPNNSWLCNVKQGATIIESKVTKEEEYLIKKIQPLMNKKSIFLYGIDTLLDDNNKRVLSEINTANVGGFTLLEKIYKKNYTEIFIKELIEYIEINKE